MKISLNFTVALLFMVITASCKKNTDAPAVVPGSKNTPNFAGPYFKFTPGTGWQQKGFIFYDLNHDANKDKKYFTAERINFTSDSMKITVASLPIDSLATNWPAQVKSASYGYNTDLIVNAHMRLLVQSVNTSGRLVYSYDSIYKLSSGIATYNYLNNSLFAGAMAGQNPQGETFFRIPDGMGGITVKNTILYFKEGYYTIKTAGHPAKLLSTLAPNASSYDWANVSNVISYSTDGTNFHYTHLFLDFKNWRYFTWAESCTPGGCTSILLTQSGYKNLDNLLKWPEGWGKL